MEGWIKLHRQLTKWGWYTDANTMRVFVHCLLRANHHRAEYMGYEIPQGAFTSTIPKMAEELNLTPKQVRVALEKLNRTGEVTSKGEAREVQPKNTKRAKTGQTQGKRKTRMFTVFQVNNWLEFQEKGQTQGRRRANAGQTQGRHNKNEQNEQNEQKPIGELENFENSEFKVLNEIVATSDQEPHMILNAIANASTEPTQVTTDDLQHAKAIKAMLYPQMGIEPGYKPSKGQILEAMSLIYQKTDNFHKARWSPRHIRNNFKSIINTAKTNNAEQTKTDDRLAEIERKYRAGEYR